MSDLVETRDIAKHYAVRGRGLRRPGTLRAVDGVSIAIRAGETLGLVGESGCGKSTLGRMVIRLVAPSAGQVLFDGADITDLDGRALREARRAMQIIFQDPYGALDPRMSCEDIVMEPLLIHGARPDAATRRRVLDTMTLCGLSPRFRGRFPHEFSGGQRQRIGIARALVLRPKFVVCDEPVSALDVSVQAQIVNLLQDLQAELGLTYLFISHDLAVVKHIADRVAVMYLGRVVELADKRTLYTAPLHPYTQALIAAAPIADPAERDAARARRRQLSGEIPSALAPPPGCRFHTRCPHVMPVCRAQEPALVAARSGHLVACHLVTQGTA
jgi:oligopeptide/dipeptide ABC transporter ATP-binding protein